MRQKDRPLVSPLYYGSKGGCFLAVQVRQGGGDAEQKPEVDGHGGHLKDVFYPIMQQYAHKAGEQTTGKSFQVGVGQSSVRIQNTAHTAD